MNLVWLERKAYCGKPGRSSWRYWRMTLNTELTGPMWTERGAVWELGCPREIWKDVMIKLWTENPDLVQGAGEKELFHRRELRGSSWVWWHLNSAINLQRWGEANILYWRYPEQKRVDAACFETSRLMIAQGVRRKSHWEVWTQRAACFRSAEDLKCASREAKIVTVFELYPGGIL